MTAEKVLGPGWTGLLSLLALTLAHAALGYGLHRAGAAGWRLGWRQLALMCLAASFAGIALARGVAAMAGL